ncbi:DUF4202 domain-containing protein [Neolewinella aurantiaca]|uniref:DUF4202 domain-containing protein n=1 Tax=Neolewinella aurantiaca TaxID=2602767 RepID=A0A5C7FYW7_9BACT|nr:DUF4202 domain-containing protein [Neolewinella aurantiaca]TXF90897.1 DUF4202 domain-containing protein [Neolewinella aurantiaca]
MKEPSKLSEAFAAIDEANAADPRTTEVDGVLKPYELVYGQRMSATLTSFAPAASPELQLAARAQHLERWAIPRSDYPMDRIGYLTWRNDQKKRHASRAAEILTPLGFSEETIARVQFLLQKKRLKQDPETQQLEDVICLVFLEHYAAGFAAQHPEEKVIDILQKTWSKMSPDGQQAALKLPLAPGVLSLVQKALSDG